MLTFGYNTNGFAHHRLEDALIILAELGYQSVALTLDYHALNPFDADLPKHIVTIRDLLRRLGLRSVIETGARFLLDPRHKHAPSLVGGTAFYGPREDFLRRAVDIAEALGSDAVSFWSGASVDDVGSAMKWRRLLPVCRRLIKYALSKNVRLAFEPEPGMFVDTMDRFATLLRKLDNPPGFGLTLDIGHLHCLGEVPIAERIHEWKPLLWNVHIEDMRHGVHDHLMFGEGEIDFPPVLRALNEVKYQGGVYVELSRHSHNAVETARQALSFLHGCSSSASEEGQRNLAGASDSFVI
jgi:sugar phosphate isomerase/epimerase